MSADPPSRRERERERHRQEILAAAESLFLERGIDAATMDDIASASEFAVGTLYRYFRSKDDLAVALVVDRVCAFAERLEAIAEGAFHAELQELLDLWEDSARRSYPLMQVMFSGRRTIPNPEDECSELFELFERVSAAVARVLGHGVEQGELDGEPDQMAVALLSLLHGLTRHAWRRRASELGAAIWTARRVFLDGCCRRHTELA
ncbi:MAG TPA: helix-turn-helix domain-containing protein [Myxococcota bacterium]|nr:helix-turn-helix domain-containing protein [Myxococcota bacterium]